MTTTTDLLDVLAFVRWPAMDRGSGQDGGPDPAGDLGARRRVRVGRLSSISNSTSGIEVGDLVPVVAGSACLGERRKTRVVNYSCQLRVLPLTIER